MNNSRTTNSEILDLTPDTDQSWNAARLFGNHFRVTKTQADFVTVYGDGSDWDIFVFDCGAHGGCDSGNAPRDRINLPTVNSQMYITATEPCLRLVMGHELFHH